MKKLLLVMVMLGLCSLSRAQNSAFYKYSNTTTGSSSSVYLIGTSTAYHNITWNDTGTVSACTVALDSSSDGITWTAGGVIAGQTCTSNGQATITNAVVNYIRITFTALSGGGTVIVSYNGWVTNPNGGGPPTGAAGGDLGLTYPNPTVLNLAHGSGLTSTQIPNNAANTTGNAATATGPQILETHTANSSASLAFTSWYTVSCTNYRLSISNLIWSTGAWVVLQFNGDSTNSDYGAWGGADGTSVGILAYNTGGGQGGGAPIIRVSETSAAIVGTNNGYNGNLIIWNPANSTESHFFSINVSYSGGTSGITTLFGTGGYYPTTAVTTLTLLPSAGTFTSGTASITCNN